MSLHLMRHGVLMLMVLVAASGPSGVCGSQIEPVRSVELQPLAAATERMIAALEYVGSPLSESQKASLQEAMKETDGRASVVKIQAVLDPLVLAIVTINAESRVSAVEGPVAKELLQNGWRTFLVKVVNEAGITPRLKIGSPNSATP